MIELDDSGLSKLVDLRQSEESQSTEFSSKVGKFKSLVKWINRKVRYNHSALDQQESQVEEDPLNEFEFGERLSVNTFVEVYKVTSMVDGASYVLKQHDMSDMTDEQKWDAYNEVSIMQ